LIVWVFFSRVVSSSLIFSNIWVRVRNRWVSSCRTCVSSSTVQKLISTNTSNEKEIMCLNSKRSVNLLNVFLRIYQQRTENLDRKIKFNFRMKNVQYLMHNFVGFHSVQEDHYPWDSMLIAELWVDDRVV
jgi:hypothetical protein